MNLTLVPVVEFEPSSLGVNSYAELLGAGQWVAHWDTVLAGSELSPLRPGSCLVPCAAFRSEEAFEALVRVHLTGPDGAVPDLDEISPIPGGYALAVADDVQLEPGCCCDLSDLTDWQAAFGASDHFKRLLIGHGNICVSREGAITTVTVESELAGHDGTTLRYDTPEFALALDAAARAQSEFARALGLYLRRIVPPAQPEPILNRLVFGT